MGYDSCVREVVTMTTIETIITAVCLLIATGMAYGAYRLIVSAVDTKPYRMR